MQMTYISKNNIRHGVVLCQPVVKVIGHLAEVGFRSTGKNIDGNHPVHGAAAVAGDSERLAVVGAGCTGKGQHSRGDDDE